MNIFCDNDRKNKFFNIRHFLLLTDKQNVIKLNNILDNTWFFSLFNNSFIFINYDTIYC
jgi:hypothetical protein